MFDHVTVNVADLGTSTAFYSQALAPLHFKQVPSEESQTGFAASVPGIEGAYTHLLLRQSTDVASTHLAFVAFDAAQVDAFYAAALQAGGVDNGAPGQRPQYGPAYYAAFVLDPDGHNIEAVFHGTTD